MRDIFADLCTAAGLSPLRAGIQDRLLPVLLVAGLAGAALGPNSVFTLAALGTLASKAFFEELVFRVLMQNQMERLWPAWPPLLHLRAGAWLLLRVTPANALVSLLFALAHVPTQPLLAALSTFFPSLAFGLVWTRTRSLWLCVALHAWYNIAYQFGRPISN